MRIEIVNAPSRGMRRCAQMDHRTILTEFNETIVKRVEFAKGSGRGKQCQT